MRAPSASPNSHRQLGERSRELPRHLVVVRVEHDCGNVTAEGVAVVVL